MAGVTGLIVAIGVTADSFIVYFERVRDEVREGRPLRAAVDTGWKRARRTILAADGVNFLAAVVLYVAGRLQRARLRLHPGPDDAHRPPRRLPLHPPARGAPGATPSSSAAATSGPASTRERLGRQDHDRGTPAADGSRSPRTAPRATEGSVACDQLRRLRQRPLHRQALDRLRRHAAALVRHLRRSSSSSALLGLVGPGLNLGLEFRGGSEFRVSAVTQPRATTSQVPRRRRRQLRGGRGPSRSPSSAPAPSACRPRSSTTPRAETVRGRAGQGVRGRPRPSVSRLVRRALLGCRRSASRRCRRWSSSSPSSSLRHGGLLPHLEDGARRPDRAAARPGHHRRHLRAGRLRGHPGDDDRLPHRSSATRSTTPSSSSTRCARTPARPSRNGRHDLRAGGEPRGQPDPGPLDQHHGRGAAADRRDPRRRVRSSSARARCSTSSLALFVGIAVGAYSSIFIATPLLVTCAEREPAVVELDKKAARYQARHGQGRRGRRGRPRPVPTRPATPGDRRQDADRAGRADGRGRDASAGRRGAPRTPRPGRATSPSVAAQVQALSRHADRRAGAARDGPSRSRQLVASRPARRPRLPEPGVVFKDITPLLARRARPSATVVARHRRRADAGSVDLVAGIEARGFILGAAVAHALGVGFVPVRKAGKLPGETVHGLLRPRVRHGRRSRCTPTPSSAGERVLVVDDVLATGGTAAAACDLLERAGAEVVGVRGVVELASSAAGRGWRAATVHTHRRRHVTGDYTSGHGARTPRRDERRTGPPHAGAVLRAPGARAALARFGAHRGRPEQPGPRAAAADRARPPTPRPTCPSSSGPTPSPSAPTEGQMRKSGDAYITHPLAVTTILAELGMTPATLAAALLHDTVEDTAYSLDAAAPRLRRRGRDARRRRHQARQGHLRRGRPGRDGAQDGRGDGPRHPGARHQARRPAAQRPHLALRLAGVAPSARPARPSRSTRRWPTGSA